MKYIFQHEFPNPLFIYEIPHSANYSEFQQKSQKNLFDGPEKTNRHSPYERGFYCVIIPPQKRDSMSIGHLYLEEINSIKQILTEVSPNRYRKTDLDRQLA